MLTFIKLTDKEAFSVQWPKVLYVHAVEVGGDDPGNFPLFSFERHHGRWNDRYRGEKEQTNRREPRGGA